MSKQKLKKIPGVDPIEYQKKQELLKKKKIKKQLKQKQKKSQRKKLNIKINYKKIGAAFGIILVCLLVFMGISNIKIKNIEIVGNDILSDQEVIDLAGLRDYPYSIKNPSYSISKKLEKNIYIESATVKKSNLLKKVTIKVKENKPLLFYTINNKTMLSNGVFVDKKFNVPVLINEVPEELLKKLVTSLNEINDEVLIRMNEIKYVPDDVDTELFLISMNDQNYVYVDTRTMKKMNDYLSMLTTFNNKKGILHLDSGDYFEMFDFEKENEDENDK